MVLYLVFLAVGLVPLTPKLLLALPVAVVIAVNGLFVGLWLGIAVARFRDVQPFMNVVVLLWMWLTPVVYPESTFGVDPKGPHPIITRLLPFNPAYHFITGFHQSLWLKQWISTRTWITCIAITLAANVLAAVVLRRSRSEIRDVL